jgi:hypothetical protein
LCHRSWPSQSSALVRRISCLVSRNTRIERGTPVMDFKTRISAVSIDGCIDVLIDSQKEPPAIRYSVKMRCSRQSFMDYPWRKPCPSREARESDDRRTREPSRAGMKPTIHFTFTIRLSAWIFRDFIQMIIIDRCISAYRAFQMLEVHRTHRATIRNHSQVEELLDRHGWSASKLWNVANYHSRRVWEETGEIPDHADLKAELKTHPTAAFNHLMGVEFAVSRPA